MNSSVLKKTIYLFALPALLIYSTFWVLPIFITFYFSLTDYTGVGTKYNYIEMDNFIQLFKDGTLVSSIQNTLIYTIVYVLFSNLFALILAFALNMDLRLKGFYRSISYVPTLFSSIVVGFIWGYVFMPDYGMISSILKGIGFGSVEPNFLGNTSTALAATAFVDIWKALGGTMVIYLAGLQTIPNELVEAGRIDGCTAWQLARNVKLPLLAASVTINITLGMINGMKAFDYIFIMTQGGPAGSSQTLIYSLFKMAFNEQQFGKGAALGVVSFAIISAITFVLVGALRKREVAL